MRDFPPVYNSSSFPSLSLYAYSILLYFCFNCTRFHFTLLHILRLSGVESAVEFAFTTAKDYSDTDRRKAYGMCLEPRRIAEVSSTEIWHDSVAELQAERDEEMIARLAACTPSATVEQCDLSALKQQLIDDKGWYRGMRHGDGSKGVYVQLLDGSLLSTDEPADKDMKHNNRGGGGGPEGSSGSAAVLSAFGRSNSNGCGDGYPSVSAYGEWQKPWLVRAKSDAELTTKVAYLGCLLQDPYWSIGGHAAAITFGARREQRCGPYPGYGEQWFRYATGARGLELWHISPMVANPEMPTTAGHWNPATGPSVPTRKRFGALEEGSVVLGVGLWVPAEVPSTLLWYTIPRSLPHAWSRQLAQLASLLDTLRNGICRAPADTAAPPRTQLVTIPCSPHHN